MCGVWTNCWPPWSISLLPELQSAYRKHRSTETATIIQVMSDVYEAVDAGSVALLGLLDLSAAFDTVDHLILLAWHRNNNTGSGDWSFRGSSLISQDAVSSYGSTGSPQRLPVTPVCRMGPSWGRSSSYPTRPESFPSFSIRASKCTSSSIRPTIYESTAQKSERCWWSDGSYVDQSCPRVTFLGLDPAKCWPDPHPRLPTKSLTWPATRPPSPPHMSSKFKLKTWNNI